MHRTRVAAASTTMAALVPVAVVVVAVILAALTGVAVVDGLGVDAPTSALLAEGGNRGW